MNPFYKDGKEFMLDPGWKTARWRYKNIEDLSEEIRGVYVIVCRKKQKCIYVGMAERQAIKSRLKSHWSGSHNPWLQSWIKAFGDYLDIRYYPMQQGISQFEKHLITLLRPETNIEGQTR